MESKPSRTKILVTAAFALSAAVSTIAAFYLWHEAGTPRQVENPQNLRYEASPRDFTESLESNLKTVLGESGITDNLVTVSRPDSTLPGINRVYRVRVPLRMSLRLLNLRITRMAEGLGGGVFQGIENPQRTSLTLKVGAGSQPTDLIILTRSSRVMARFGKMAVIVDDFGARAPDGAERLCALDQEVTLSILPFQSNTRAVVDLARRTGTAYIAHIPMEPQSRNEDPGEGALKTADPAQAIRDKLARAFRSIEGAPGCNNHMGSLATEDVRVMEAFMGWMAEQGLFFVDSQTSRQSVGHSLAQKRGVKSAKLTSFLDVENDPAAIEQRLRSLADRACDGELVVAIGHDRPHTIDVLERVLPELAEQGIVFIPASEAVR